MPASATVDREPRRFFDRVDLFAGTELTTIHRVSRAAIKLIQSSLSWTTCIKHSAVHILPVFRSERKRCRSGKANKWRQPPSKREYAWQIRNWQTAEEVGLTRHLKDTNRDIRVLFPVYFAANQGRQRGNALSVNDEKNGDYRGNHIKLLEYVSRRNCPPDGHLHERSKHDHILSAGLTGFRFLCNRHGLS